MTRIIATNSCHSQQLKRVADRYILQLMVANTKEDFAERLNTACDNADPPIQKGRGRRAELRRRVFAIGLDVSGESVRKWLSADTIPSMDNLRFIARALGVAADWLLTGRPTTTIKQAPDGPRVLSVNEPDQAPYIEFNASIRTVIEIMKRNGSREQERILWAAQMVEAEFLKDTQNPNERAG